MFLFLWQNQYLFGDGFTNYGIFQPGGDPLVLCFVDFVSPAHAATAMDALQGKNAFSISVVVILERYVRIQTNLIFSSDVISVMPSVELSICLESLLLYFISRRGAGRLCMILVLFEAKTRFSFILFLKFQDGALSMLSKTKLLLALLINPKICCCKICPGFAGKCWWGRVSQIHC